MEDNRMKDVLIQFAGKTELLAVFSDANDSTKFHIGYVLVCGEDHYAMSLVSPYGRFDGFLVQSYGEVRNIQYGTKYVGKMMTLIKHHIKELSTITLDRSNLVYSLLEHAMSAGSIIKISRTEGAEISGSIEQGYVDDVNPENCKIHLVDEYGIYDGYGYYWIDDVIAVSTEGEDEIMLEILNNEYFK